MLTSPRFTLRTLLPAVSALALCAWPGLAAAQQVHVLDTISLLGTGLPVTVKENPSAVSVVEADRIAEIPPARVADYLRDVPGVRVEEQGITRISIRGEDARRVRILIDGQAVTDHTTYGPPVVVDPSMVERIEVVRGASSVVSGQRAIGGTINIITRKGGEKPFEGSTTLSWFGATQGWRMSNTIAGRQGGFSWRLSQGKSIIGNQRAAGLGEIPNTDVHDKLLSGFVGYETGPHSFGLQATAFDLGANVYIPPGQPAGFSIAMPRRDLRKLGAFYEGRDLTPWLSSLKVDAFRQTIDREFRNNVPVVMPPTTPFLPGLIVTSNEDRQLTWGLNVTGELRLTERWRSVVGLQYENDFIDANGRSEVTPPRMPVAPPSTITTLREDDARIRTASVFMQNEFTLSPRLVASAGLRYYNVRATHEASNNRPTPLTTNSDSRLLGSLGLTWSPDERWTLRGLVSQGYNYPTLNQMFTSTSAGGQVTVPNPLLRPETSDNIELGARFEGGGTVLDATLFHSRAKDYILRGALPAGVTDPACTANTTCGRYQNVSSARSTGLEIYAEHGFENGWTPFVSAAWIHRKLDYGNGVVTSDSGTPALAGTLGLRRDLTLWNRNASVEVNLNGESAVRLVDSTGALAASYSGWATVGLRGSIDLGENARLTVGVNNITNRAYHGYNQIPGAERNLDLVLHARF